MSSVQVANRAKFKASQHFDASPRLQMPAFTRFPFIENK